MATKYITDGDFCEIVSDKFVEHGVKRGRVVWIAGHRAFPIAENDPYTQRIKFMVHLTEDQHVKPALGLFIMDPDSLFKLLPKDQAILKEIMDADFDKPADASVN
jgi:hypothetical protein